MIFLACAGTGFQKAALCRREIRQLEQLQLALGCLERELAYGLPPLPELLESVARQCGGVTAKVFADTARELDAGRYPEVSGCMQAAADRCGGLTGSYRMQLKRLGSHLGKFALSGQLSGLQELQALGRKRLEACSKRETERIRTFRTLGICAGAALVILLM